MTKSVQVFVVLLGVATASVAAAQDPGNVDYVEECPVENGFFADAVQCDRYYECKDGVVRSSLIDIFNILNSKKLKYPFRSSTRRVPTAWSLTSRATSSPSARSPSPSTAPTDSSSRRRSRRRAVPGRTATFRIRIQK